MKNLFLILTLLLFMLCSNGSSCDKKTTIVSSENTTKSNTTNDMENSKIKIKVNSKTFTATLLDNNAAKAFQEMLPMTINMTELNNDEKYFDLPKSLPTNSSNPGTTKKGDLMLFGSRTLVLFYQTQSTSYRYSKLGKVDDATGLAEALGSGNVTVTFQLE